MSNNNANNDNNGNNVSNANNIWSNDESDDDYNDEEIILNEESSTDINPEFRKNVLRLKRKLYYKTVLKGKLGTKEAQNIGVLDKYLDNLNKVHILCLNAQNPQNPQNNNIILKKFPKKTRKLISSLLFWIADYFKKNELIDTIPYKVYIDNSFKKYPFVQKNSFN